MKILRLRIENLNSLKLRQSIDFVQAPLGSCGLFAITGDTGAGKTTILDAITLALYGRVHRNKEVMEVMSYGATDCLAEVEFTSARGLFRARWSTYRSRGKQDGNIQAPKRELAQWDEKEKAFRIIAEMKKEVDNLVEEVCGLDYDRFTRSVLLAQGDFAAFLQAGERERSDLLERITGTGIYTRLSIAAFERAKAEQLKLDDLRRQQQALQLLDSREIDAIQAELTENQEKAARLRHELNTLREQIQWYTRKTALEEQLQQLQAQEAEEQQKRAVFQDNEIRLNAHQRAQPYEALLEKEEEGAIQLAQLSEELVRLQQQEAEGKEVLTALEARFQQEKEAVGAISQQKKQYLPIFDEVIALDKDLQAGSETLAALTEEKVVLEAELVRLGRDIADTQGRLAQGEGELAAVREWLNAHADRSQLSILLPEVDRKREEMRQVVQQQKQWETKREALLREQAGLQVQDLKLAEELARSREELSASHEIFRKDLPTGYALSRNELLHSLHQDIELLGEQQKQWQELHRINAEYRESLALLVEYESQIESLSHQEMEVDKQVISNMDALDWERQQLEYRQAVFEQQQLIANYEKDRHRLPEGEPCPLCLSTQHPFREHPVTPFVDKARQDYEKSRRRFDSLHQEQNRLLGRQKELKLQKEQLLGDEREEMSGQIIRQQERLELLEAQIAGAINRSGVALSDQDHASFLDLKIAEMEEGIAAKKQLRDRLLALSAQLDGLEKKVQGLEAVRQESQNQLRILTERVLGVTEQIKETGGRYEGLMAEVRDIYRQFGRQFEPETAKTVYQSLKADHEEYLQQGELERQLQQQTVVDREKIDQWRQNEKREIARFEKLEKRWAEAGASVRTLRQKRSQLLGEKDPRIEKEKLELAWEQGQTGLNQLQEQLHTQQAQLHRVGLLQENNKLAKEKLEKQLNNWRASLSKAAQAAGFSGVEALSAALLDSEEAEQLQNTKNQLERDSLAIRQSLHDVEKAIELLLQSRTTEISAEDLLAHLSIREEDFQTLQQMIGGLSERLAANDKQQKTAGRLVKQIAGQEQEFNRWAQLNEIIGQADGKKFRIFAQGLTLSKLVEMANHHLGSLNGRYLIRKRSDDDLELEIIDTYQADNTRSMNTLSGGESFLVSLALALGLSDLAGRDARIQSLFIDEGFGTLDENSLDLAIDTLENLQSNGKTIGIISHVKALKERIGTQILVTKQGTGFSEIAIVG